MDLDTKRRRVLQAAGGLAAAVGLAGCAGGQSAGTSPSDSPAATSTTDRTSEGTDDREAEPAGTKTVFHFSGAPDEQGHAVANVRNLLADETVETAEVALVTNGSGIELLTESGTSHAEAVATLAERGVSLLVCSNSMDALGVAESDLLPDAESVPSGVGELSRLQSEGYGYIKTP
ncbi:hypothetical protein BV210_12155 [Halorientalis sp. IM1011]|uniref:DsrE family protein n=1 Tax=Halorientalis sp. IM1011 TaxID=1932360 RepID=UPI00097CD529|nr:DsrE family protein [Halorientalis sp. IM1011]AQL43397.1 hypothetical protein BV210_12155 [Halorientalis sp. IM1011]